MKDKRNMRRAAYLARQEKEGKKTVMWIVAVLVILALCFIGYAAVIMS